MSNANVIPKRMTQYLRRLRSEYAGTVHEPLGQVIVGSEFRVEEETDQGWYGEERGFNVTFLVPDHLIVNIPLDEQEQFEARVKNDLNKASSAAKDEFVANVYFDYLDEDGTGERLILDQPSEAHDYEKLWSATSVRLFISHRDIDKRRVHELASHLNEHGISLFVAHETIEPDEDWQREIRRALQSMDAMLVYITDDIFASIWVNQEIGYALARSVPIISIKCGAQDPAGFIHHRQAILGANGNPQENARKIRETLRKKLLGSPRYREVTLHRFAKSSSFRASGSAFEDLVELNGFSNDELVNLVNAYNSNNQLHDCWKLSRGDRFLKFVNNYSEKGYVVERKRIVESQTSVDDDIPF